MPDTAVNTAKPRNPATNSLWMAAFFAVALLFVFYETTWSVIAIWLRSDTYAHGFLIFPIAVWLVWDSRELLRQYTPAPKPWIIGLLVPPGSAWLLASLVDVSVIQQLALVSMLVVGVWAILGHQLTRALAFPLCFLFLAVPMGEGLVPYMMEFTATSTVWLIQQTGIPVFREGLYFTLPSGNWSVVEACSGVRYIIASITLGVIYAYLTYRTFRRRIAFIVVSALVPVLANSARAFMIVMLGHTSDMQVATGVDHLVYGWLFFGLIMFLLFWLGSYFRQDRASDEAIITAVDEPRRASLARLAVTASMALLLCTVWPLLSYQAQVVTDVDEGMLEMPSADEGNWRSVTMAPWRWQPYSAVAGQSMAFYERDSRVVGLYVQYPKLAVPSGEIVGSLSRFVTEEDGWRVINRTRHEMTLDDVGNTAVEQVQLAGMGESLLAWSWYRIGHQYSANDYFAKLLEAKGSLGIGHSGTYRIVLVAQATDDVESVQALLHNFLLAHASPLEASLDRALVRAQR